MNKIRIAISVVGAIMGIGGAYASAHLSGVRDVTTYNWYLANGELAFSATIAVAKSVCPSSGALTCLRGTATAQQVHSVVLRRP